MNTCSIEISGQIYQIPSGSQTYIYTEEGVLYLSMIRDLYDSSIAAYKTATQQTVNLVMDTICLAMKAVKKRVAAELQLHSDQGFQHTSQAYFDRASVLVI